jgi:hypothetical protein
MDGCIVEIKDVAWHADFSGFRVFFDHDRADNILLEAFQSQLQLFSYD